MYTVHRHLLNVRRDNAKQSNAGLPKGSPESCAYFSHPEHAHDRYSIGFRFIPKKAISGEDLRFGNDFDKPIRDHLPPGFSSAFWIVKHVLDPGLDGDVRADKPHLYGPVLSSVDAIRIADKKADFADVPHDDAGVEVEGADGDALQLRADLGIPDDPKRRRKFFLDTSHRQNFTFEAGRLYRCDFFNPYLDFNGENAC